MLPIISPYTTYPSLPKKFIHTFGELFFGVCMLLLTYNCLDKKIEVYFLFSGPGLAFVAFPTALSHMPVPQMWSVLFFLMLITVVFDSLVRFLILS